MNSAVDICNLALTHLGSSELVVSLNPPDGSVNAGYCQVYLPAARQEVLEGHDWSFARRRATLAQVGPLPPSGWLYRYALPAECLFPRRIPRIAIATFEASMLEHRHPHAQVEPVQDTHDAHWVREGQTILTNEPDAQLVYTTDVQDYTQWTPMAKIALSYMLAAYLAGPIVRGSEGARTAVSFREQARGVFGQAAASDGNQGRSSWDFVPSGIANR